VLRRHQPDHILLRATRADAAGGLTDLARIGLMLDRARGHLRVRVLDRVSPLAVPVLLDIGREVVRTAQDEDALLMETEELVAEAMGDRPVLAVLRPTAERLKRDRAARRAALRG
jgi:ATP-dependent Lhr-like helicase